MLIADPVVLIQTYLVPEGAPLGVDDALGRPRLGLLEQLHVPEALHVAGVRARPYLGAERATGKKCWPEEVSGIFSCPGEKNPSSEKCRKQSFKKGIA